jgi:hypothetical protein
VRHARVYGGTLEDTITTEADLDAELETKQLLFDQEYAGSFDLNTFAVMGHNITAGAAVKVQANDWDEWTYVNGSGSSIIQRVMAWDEETMLYFWSQVYKRQYIKLTVNDPGNTEGVIKIGRIWAGKYLTIDPSSLLNFRVTKRRSDRVIYGINRQKWADEGVGWRRFELEFPPTETEMLDKLQMMYDAVGNHTSVIFCNFDSLRTWQIVEPVYCSIVGDIEFAHKRNMKFGWRISLEEDK